MSRLSSMSKAVELNAARAAVLLVAALFLSGCQILGFEDRSTNSVESAQADQSLIAYNLVDALAQYPKLNPLMASVQVSNTPSAFEERVYLRMSDLGYKIEESADGENTVVATVSALEDAASDEQVQLYTLVVGQVSAERQFGVVAGRTVPLSPMTVRGDERTVRLNDEELFGSADERFTQVAFLPSAVPADLKAQTDALDVAIATDVADVADATATTDPSDVVATTFPTVAQMLKPQDAGQDIREPALIRRNMYDTMESNFSSVFTEYENVEQSVLIFPNDSLRLGETNKQIIEKYVDMMNPETDLLSVIGCSHGPSDISNGNSLLALGRANRVKEAFLFSGVVHEQVLDEGCWAPTSFGDVMPARGVVLTLKRRANS